MSEPFSWSKFFGGIVDPIGYFKTLADALRAIIVIAILIAIFIGAVKVKRWLFPDKPKSMIFTVSGQTGGEVRNSADQRTNKFGVFTF